MKKFSERKGLIPKKTIQLESMDSELRIGLWNCVYNHIFINIDVRSPITRLGEYDFFEFLWVEFFKSPVDDLRKEWGEDLVTWIKPKIVTELYFKVYDLLEFLAQTYPYSCEGFNNFINECNRVLERENAGYRFAGKFITDIVNPEELQEIENALETPLDPVREHLQTSLQLLADRENPIYRKSIQESIHAVEALCRIITNNPKAELGDALKEIEKHMELHGALRSAFRSLYGYTSDADGIRHSLLDESNLNSEDARFMLIACSAFINYLTEKAIKAGIELKPITPR